MKRSRNPRQVRFINASESYSKSLTALAREYSSPRLPGEIDSSPELVTYAFLWLWRAISSTLSSVVQPFWTVHGDGDMR